MTTEQADQDLAAFFHCEPNQLASVEDVLVCYRRILKREPEPNGLKYYREAIETGHPRRILIQGFVNSEEFRGNPDTAHIAEVMAAYEANFGSFAKTDAVVKWFHSMPMPDGKVTDGVRPIDVLRREADCIFRMGMEGKSLLDIGAWDGFFSFEAERRGAADILSTDHFCWSGPGWGTKAGYDLTHAAWGSKARTKDVDVFDLDPDIEGTFDVVLFLGVLYHLKNPYGGLEQAARMSKDLLIVETVTDCNHTKTPVMRHYLDTELNHDPTNFFAPNTACLESILRELGFSKIEIERNPGLIPPEGALKKAGGVFDRDRHIVHAWR